SVSSFPHQSARRVPPIRAQARSARRARIWEGPQARRQRSCRAPARVGIKTTGFAPSGGFFDACPSPYTEIVTGAYTAAWVGLATYAVIDALGGASAGATAGGAAVATPTTSTLSAEFVVVGINFGKAPGGAVSTGLAVGSGIQILDADNTPLPDPAVPARSPTPGQAPTGNAKGQSLGRVGPARGYPTAKSKPPGTKQKPPPPTILTLLIEEGTLYVRPSVGTPYSLPVTSGKGPCMNNASPACLASEGIGPTVPGT